LLVELLDPGYIRALQENLLTLTNTLQSLSRSGFDDSGRLRTRTEYLDDGWLKIRLDATSAFEVSIVEVLKEFSWVLYNLAEMSSLLSRILVIQKASIFNTSIAANTNIFSSDLTPSYSPTLFRIYACFSASGVLTVRRTRGGTTVSEILNAGSSLNANCAYMFDVIVESGDSINLQYSVAATAICIRVVEVPMCQ